MITRAIEDYLKAIYQVEADLGEVTTTHLAERLHVAPASVTGMLKKLATLDLVTYTPYQGVRLTAEGQSNALRIIRYHRLAERYLLEVVGLPWDEVHAEAEEWEHVLSERVVRRLDAIMGRPTTDPHGEPIPGADGAISAAPGVPLASLRGGETATIARVHSQDAELLRYLGSLGMYPGAALSVKDVAPFDGPLTVNVSQQERVIGRVVAERVFVVDVHPA